MEASAQETRDAAVLDGARDIAYGSAAGMVSKVFEHPFDLCKVRLQAQVLDHTARFRGPVDCLAATWRNEGVRGLYRGLPAPVVGAMAENATLFLTYGQLQRLARWLSGAPPGAGELRSSQLAFAAAGAGAVTSFLLTPIELIKCKMQVQLLVREQQPQRSASPRPPPRGGAPPAPDFRSFPGPLGVLRSVVRAHGARGLWLGQTGTLIRETGGAVAWFGAKEAESESLLTSRDLRAWESAAAGACAGVAYNVVLFPADSVKSALQTAEELRPPRAPGAPRRTFWGVAREMYARRGVRGLYAGLGITTARAAPSSAMIFLIYDGLSKRFG
ncbi:mitochondrial carrier [Phellopilus nigrolimitatus]|nr:mitochondrial carrier [Phellopilus nigrolimitatus]